jgi:hypothetical protein
LKVAATIPDPLARDQFADRLAVRARVTEGVIRDEIKKAAAQRRVEAPAIALPAAVRLRPAEEGLVWALMHRPVEGLAAVAQLDSEDTEGLLMAPVLALAASLSDMPPAVLPELLRERLTDSERSLLERSARPDAPMASAAECVKRLKLDRYLRELAGVQNDIEQLQQAQTSRPSTGAVSGESDELLERKLTLVRKIELLKD